MPYSVERGGGHPHYKYSVKHVSRPNILKKLKNVKISNRYCKGVLARKIRKSENREKHCKTAAKLDFWMFKMHFRFADAE